MDYRIFPDLDQFVTAWYDAQANLTQMQKDIVHASLHDRQTLAEIAQRYGITREYVRQIAEKGAKRLLREARKDRRNPVRIAVAKAAKIADRAGLEIALRPRSLSTKSSETVIQQLTNIGAISHDQTSWALVILDTMPKPKRPRLSLRRLVHDARQVAGYHHRGITPRHLRDHLTQWHDTIAQWPGFNIALHIKAMTGTATDPKTGAFHPIKGWTIPIKNDPLFTKHYITRALDKAGQPLTIPEIVQSANHLARLDGIDRTYTTVQVAGTIHVHKGYKWAGPSTYGLKSWDVGHSSDIQPTSERTQITQEIVHLLLKSTEPVAYDDIRQHILGRFNVTPGAVYFALAGKRGGQRFTIHPDRTVSLNPQDADPPSI